MSNIKCNICYEETGNIYKTVCNHEFCEECYGKWSQHCNKNDKDITCPYCRQHLQYCNKNGIYYNNSWVYYVSYTILNTVMNSVLPEAPYGEYGMSNDIVY